MVAAARPKHQAPRVNTRETLTRLMHRLGLLAGNVTALCIAAPYRPTAAGAKLDVIDCSTVQLIHCRFTTDP